MAVRIMSMKNYNNSIRNRTRDLPTCGALPKPTALRRAPFVTVEGFESFGHISPWPPAEILSTPGLEHYAK